MLVLPPSSDAEAEVRARRNRAHEQREAAISSLALLFTYVMSGTASVTAWYALFAIVIVVMWKTSSWLGVDGLVASYRQHRRHESGLHTPVRDLLSRVAAGTPTVDKNV